MKSQIRRRAALLAIVAIGLTSTQLQAQNLGQGDEWSSSDEMYASFDNVVAGGQVGGYHDGGNYGGGSYGGGGYDGGDYAGGDYAGGCNNGGCYDGGCYECGEYCDGGGGGGDWFDCNLFGTNPCWIQCFAGVEYLYLRSNFSEAMAYRTRDLTDLSMPTTTYHELDHKHEGSYRLWAGIMDCFCGWDMSLRYSHFENDALSRIFPPDNNNIFLDVPLEAVPPPGGRTDVRGNVELDSYDVGLSKTICLGGPVCCDSCGCGDACGCGDPCGCGDGCGCGDCCGCCDYCPSWDLTFSGGLRYVDIEHNHLYTAFSDTDEVVTDARSRMNFQGGGIRLGMLTRRYLNRCGTISAFVKGDISLLLGHVEVDDQREQIATTPGVVVKQRLNARNIIPVTELEAGMTAHITCNCQLSGGYMLAAYHDLGLRESFFPFGSADLPIAIYDDANILSFDGLFMRLETAF